MDSEIVQVYKHRPGGGFSGLFVIRCPTTGTTTGNIIDIRPEIILSDVKFVVDNEIKEGRNVHAWVEGRLVEGDDVEGGGKRVDYDPDRFPYFFTADDGKITAVYEADWCLFSYGSVWANFGANLGESP